MDGGVMTGRDFMEYKPLLDELVLDKYIFVTTNARIW